MAVITENSSFCTKCYYSNGYYQKHSSYCESKILIIYIINSITLNNLNNKIVWLRSHNVKNARILQFASNVRINIF